MNVVAVSMATVVLESLLYGLLLIVFSTNLYLRITRYARPQEFVSRGGLWWNPIVISNTAIFATCTAHWIINVDRFFLAFLASGGNPLQFYRNKSQPTSVVNNTLVVMAVLIGDVVIIHRLWLVWNRNLRVVFFPLLSWLGALADGIAVPYFLTQSTSTNRRFLTAAGPWLIANWILTTVITIYCTTFIAWRIWRTSRATAEVGGGLLMPVFVILIESAAIWTAWTIFLTTSFLMGSKLAYILLDLTPAIIGLVNLLIHLRVGLGWSRAEVLDATSAPMTSSASIFAVNLRTENNEHRLESVSQTGPASRKSGV
ncbi:hypothetical protein C8R44DRAFT_882447 [Mycena epipterygia]|nr:hypothetical protein C8R44DRAFT_882447 [Mycena epipterygia]